MGLFKKNIDGVEEPRKKHNLFGKETVLYDRTELMMKAKSGKMSFEESEALRKYQKKDVLNQVLRLIGLLTVLTLVIFAVGTFLYPYSLFNLFGDAKFWDCWGNLAFRIDSNKYLDFLETNFPNHIKYDTEGNIASANTWITLHEAYSFGVRDTTPAIWNFYVIGGWSIIPLATIGFILIIVVSIYLLIYNIRDLVLVIQHLHKKTKVMVTDIAYSAKETAAEVKEDYPEKKSKRRRKKVEKKEEVAEDSEPVSEVGLTESEEKELSDKVDAYKKELEEPTKEEPKVEVKPVKKPEVEVRGLSDADLDKLLK